MGESEDDTQSWAGDTVRTVLLVIAIVVSAAVLLLMAFPQLLAGGGAPADALASADEIFIAQQEFDEGLALYIIVHEQNALSILSESPAGFRLLSRWKPLLLEEGPAISQLRVQHAALGNMIEVFAGPVPRLEEDRQVRGQALLDALRACQNEAAALLWHLEASRTDYLKGIEISDQGGEGYRIIQFGDTEWNIANRYLQTYRSALKATADAFDSFYSAFNR